MNRSENLFYISFPSFLDNLAITFYIVFTSFPEKSPLLPLEYNSISSVIFVIHRSLFPHYRTSFWFIIVPEIPHPVSVYRYAKQLFNVVNTTLLWQPSQTKYFRKMLNLFTIVTFARTFRECTIMEGIIVDLQK